MNRGRSLHGTLSRIPWLLIYRPNWKRQKLTYEPVVGNNVIKLISVSDRVCYKLKLSIFILSDSSAMYFSRRQTSAVVSLHGRICVLPLLLVS